MNDEQEKSGSLFKVSLIILSLYGLIGWEILLCNGCPGIVVALIFIILSAMCIATRPRDESYQRTEYVGSKHTFKTDERNQKVDKGKIEDKLKLDFLRHLFILVARLAKADGVVDKSEVEKCLSLFAVYNVGANEHQELKQAFNKAVTTPDELSIYQHADCIAKYAHDYAARVFIYDFLWDVACADGNLAPAEKEILRKICLHLVVDQQLFDLNYNRRNGTFVDQEEREKVGGKQREWYENNDRRDSQTQHSALAKAYATIGCSLTDTFEDVKATYRRMAKAYHPDVLRANHVPEDLIVIANKKMIALNKAWELIEKYQQGA